jgi:hypothetical protein
MLFYLLSVFVIFGLAQGMFNMSLTLSSIFTITYYKWKSTISISLRQNSTLYSFLSNAHFINCRIWPLVYSFDCHIPSNVFRHDVVHCSIIYKILAISWTKFQLNLISISAPFLILIFYIAELLNPFDFMMFYRLFDQLY